MRRFPSPLPAVFPNPEGFPCGSQCFFNRNSRFKHPPGNPRSGTRPSRGQRLVWNQLSSDRARSIPSTASQDRESSHCHGNRIPAPGTLKTLQSRAGPAPAMDRAGKRRNPALRSSGELENHGGGGGKAQPRHRNPSLRSSGKLENRSTKRREK